MRSDEPFVSHSRGLNDGQAAFTRGAWTEACARLAAADLESPLDPEDLDRLATAAYLVGEDATSVQARTRAHGGFAARGDAIGAARSAFWLAFALLERPGQQSQAAGWLARAQRHLEDVEDPCVEHGWLLCATGRQRAAAGDIPSAHAAFVDAEAVGRRFGSRDLVALARHGQGRALVGMQQTAAGLALLDEVMVEVAGGEVTPIVAGAVYCSVITACHDLFDLRRAQEWTTALQDWCVANPDVVPFRGHCLIRRSEVMQLHGAWDGALGEAQRACGRLTDPSSHPEAGAAYYQLAELHRLRGEIAQADEAYRLASQAGRKPQPGLALLRLRQGQTEAAETSIKLALHETRDGRMRVLLLGAAVEILLAAGDVAGAHAAADELAQFASRHALPFLRAVSGHATGAVALAEGDALAALDALRIAADGWRELDAPYALAQTRTLVGLTYRELGDHEGARLEIECAHDVFETLGASSDAARTATLIGQDTAPMTTALTGREIEVLRLIATGVTNRTIAAQLEISEKTVARHVSNIFTKLDLPSRAAATAYAYQHHLV
jgi:DNA-binding CsgD family transcriptional regulator/tetratricopeptide (TPR) repeat protein